jgi:hypothetical protein
MIGLAEPSVASLWRVSSVEARLCRGGVRLEVNQVEP